MKVLLKITKKLGNCGFKLPIMNKIIVLKLFK
jgi:hypothetical protein